MIIELLHSLNERIVGVTRYREYVILATECNVYRLSGSGAEDIRPIHAAPVEAPTEGQDMSNPNGPGMAGFPADAWAEDQFPNRVDGRWMVDDTTLEIERLTQGTRCNPTAEPSHACEHCQPQAPPMCPTCDDTGFNTILGTSVPCEACLFGDRARRLGDEAFRAGTNVHFGDPQSKLDETKLEAHNVAPDPRGKI